MAVPAGLCRNRLAPCAQIQRVLNLVKWGVDESEVGRSSRTRVGSNLPGGAPECESSPAACHSYWPRPRMHVEGGRHASRCPGADVLEPMVHYPTFGVHANRSERSPAKAFHALSSDATRTGDWRGVDRPSTWHWPGRPPPKEPGQQDLSRSGDWELDRFHGVREEPFGRQ